VSSRQVEAFPLAPLLVDAQLPPLARLLASPIVQSANLVNPMLSLSNQLYLQAVIAYAELSARDARFENDFEMVLAEYVADAAATKALGGKFLEAVLTARVQKGEGE